MNAIATVDNGSHGPYVLVRLVDLKFPYIGDDVQCYSHAGSFGLDPENARRLARMLIEAADKLEAK